MNFNQGYNIFGANKKRSHSSASEQLFHVKDAKFTPGNYIQWIIADSNMRSLLKIKGCLDLIEKDKPDEVFPLLPPSQVQDELLEWKFDSLRSLFITLNCDMPMSVLNSMNIPERHLNIINTLREDFKNYSNLFSGEISLQIRNHNDDINNVKESLSKLIIIILSEIHMWITEGFEEYHPSNMTKINEIKKLIESFKDFKEKSKNFETECIKKVNDARDRHNRELKALNDRYEIAATIIKSYCDEATKKRINDDLVNFNLKSAYNKICEIYGEIYDKTSKCDKIYKLFNQYQWDPKLYTVQEIIEIMNTLSQALESTELKLTEEMRRSRLMDIIDSANDPFWSQQILFIKQQRSLDKTNKEWNLNRVITHLNSVQHEIYDNKNMFGDQNINYNNKNNEREVLYKTTNNNENDHANKKQKIIICSFCNKQGHLINACWNKNKCPHCNKTGHNPQKCVMLRKDNTNNQKDRHDNNKNRDVQKSSKNNNSNKDLLASKVTPILK